MVGEVSRRNAVWPEVGRVRVLRDVDDRVVAAALDRRPAAALGSRVLGVDSIFRRSLGAETHLHHLPVTLVYDLGGRLSCQATTAASECRVELNTRWTESVSDRLCDRGGQSV